MIDIEYTVIKTSRRKTIGITVSPDNKVSVIAPYSISDKDIESIVTRKTKWIKSKIKFNKQVKHPYKPKEYVSGESFSYLGRNYRLRIIHDGEDSGVRLISGYFIIDVGDIFDQQSISSIVKLRLENWYKEKALTKFTERVKLYSKHINIKCTSINVKTFKIRWGSCTSTGNLTFNWKIIMAPISVIDYVVIHELCHLKYHNHSKAYWSLLERIIPNYRERKDWLRVNGSLLTL